MTSSRYQRPSYPSRGLFVQERDQALLRAVYDHRYLTAAHLHALCFRGASLRVVQTRLRKLWEHHFLERRFLPVVVGGARPTRPAGEPLYSLAHAGAVAVGEQLGLDPARIPHTPSANAHGYATLEHHLMATDLIVALAAESREHGDVRLASFERETTLRRLLHQWRQRHPSAPALVPDGAFTLEYRHTGHRSTYYLEVIRAGVKGGNRKLGEKMRQYTALLHSGFFRDAYGHGHVRAVLMLTTTARRAEVLRQVAARLSHGTRLFWFGAAQSGRDGPTTTTTDAMLAKTWTAADGQPVSFISAVAPGSEHRR